MICADPAAANHPALFLAAVYSPPGSTATACSQASSRARYCVRRRLFLGVLCSYYHFADLISAVGAPLPPPFPARAVTFKDLRQHLLPMDRLLAFPWETTTKAVVHILRPVMNRANGRTRASQRRRPPRICLAVAAYSSRRCFLFAHATCRRRHHRWRRRGSHCLRLQHQA